MSKKILVVDDEEDIGLLMKAILSHSGYHVLYASNLSDARNFLIEEEIHMVFLDLNLGDEYGLTLLPLIRKTNRDANVVVITAQKESKIRDDVTSSGIKRLIEKPFNKKEILTVLNKKYQSQRSNGNYNQNK